MPIERPTFHEAWYRVANLKPRLLSSVRVYRQTFRSQIWYVLENSAANQYSRLSEAAYIFVGLLDGHRTVAKVWQICNERLGDSAPTQGEVIQILGQLYTNNLLYANLPIGSEALFRRYQKRRTREVQTQLMSLLYLRVPLFDPDPFLKVWVKLFGSVYSLVGFILWLVLVGTGLNFALGDSANLLAEGRNVLALPHLWVLYLAFVICKLFHEFGHAFSCKRFGLLNQSQGEVHTMGIMFLIFFPIPYVDASSAWTFRSRWHRAVVGLAGVFAELAIASVAAIVWAHTSPGFLHGIAYKIMFIASVSTLVFNGNPLLRFDAYYVLADLIEIPNLGQRAVSYIQYLFKRYAWGVRKAVNPANSISERFWFVFYGVASLIYRVYISIRILLFLNKRLPEQLFILIPVLIVSALIGWLGVPLVKLFKTLTVGQELARCRRRAVIVTLSLVVGLLIGLGLIRVPEYWRVEGVVEPNSMAVVFAETEGFVQKVQPDDTLVTPADSILVQAVNRDLQTQLTQLQDQLSILQKKQSIAQTEEMAAVQILDEQIQAQTEQIQRVEQQLADLNLRPPQAGTWVSPEVESWLGRYVRRGEPLGLVADFNDMIIRATANQGMAAILIDQHAQRAQIRARGRPQVTWFGRILEIAPAGQQQLFSEALAHVAGGSVAVRPTKDSKQKGMESAERFFEIRIRPLGAAPQRLHMGQRVVARLQTGSRPLLAQWYRRMRQLIQRRFYI